MSAVPPRRAGAGSSMNDATRELGAALGVAVLGSLGRDAATRSAIDAATGGLTSEQQIAARSSLAGADAGGRHPAGRRGQTLRVAAQERSSTASTWRSPSGGSPRSSPRSSSSSSCPAGPSTGRGAQRRRGTGGHGRAGDRRGDADRRGRPRRTARAPAFVTRLQQSSPIDHTADDAHGSDAASARSPSLLTAAAVIAAVAPGAVHAARPTSCPQFEEALRTYAPPGGWDVAQMSAIIARESGCDPTGTLGPRQRAAADQRHQPAPS